MLDALGGTHLWLIDDPERLQGACRLLAHHVHAHGFPTRAQLEAEREASAHQLRKVRGGVAVIPLHGMIEQKMSLWSYFGLGCSTEACEMALDAHLADKSVDAIVLDVDSGGGGVYGIQELADRLFEARKQKPLYAVANSMAASAAYWLASSAGNLIATPGADVGSVGVYALHADLSAALAEEGVKVTLVKAGSYKAETAPFFPLSAEAKDYLQQQVDETYATFVKSVARNRNCTAADVRANYGQGRVLSASAALSAGMIDRVATMSSVMEKLSGSKDLPRDRMGMQADVALLRKRQAQRKRTRPAD